eukprot:scaffold1284_cov108-Cylindrotheca_fusiformis.AAC.22
MGTHTVPASSIQNRNNGRKRSTRAAALSESQGEDVVDDEEQEEHTQRRALRMVRWFRLITRIAITVIIAIRVGVRLFHRYGCPKCRIRMELMARVVLPGVDVSNLDRRSPQYFALKWLVCKDPRHMSIKDDATELLERFSLATVYYSTGGKNWVRDNQWLSGSSHCDWENFNCDKRGRVTTMNHEFNNVYGTLPPEIGNLKRLKNLRITGNRFLAGTIPSEIGNLQQLTTLYLYRNNLSGTIPSEIGNLQQLRYLWLSHNTFSGIIPSEIGNLQQLTALRLGLNTFSGIIPSEIGNMQRLKALFLSGNNFFSGTIPSEIGNLQRLKTLWLNSTSVSGTIPREIGNLQQLISLCLHDNIRLTGTMPVEVSKLESIYQARFQNTSLAGRLDDLAFCKNRDVSNNNFELEADCRGSNPKITYCECCTKCCDTDGGSCVYSSYI